MKKTMFFMALIISGYCSASRETFLEALSFYEGDGQDQDREKARALFERTVEEGDQPYAAAALYHLGRIYYNGRGVRRDRREAQDYFARALAYFNDWLDRQLQDPQVKYYLCYARYYIGKMKFHGCGAGQNHEAALFSYILASAPDYADPIITRRAQAEIAHCYLHGHGTEQDHQQARTHLLRLAEGCGDNRPESLDLMLGEYALRNNHVQDSTLESPLDSFGRVAQGKYFSERRYDALFSLGLLRSGVSVHYPNEVDGAGAVECFLRVVRESQRSAFVQKALFQLGLLYARGLGDQNTSNFLPPDHPQSISYLKQAVALAGHSATAENAAFYLGAVYVDGSGVPCDRRRARELLRCANSEMAKEVLTMLDE